MIKANQTSSRTAMPGVTDELLISSFYGGDDEALETLFKRYNSRLTAFAKARGLEHDTAQEQTQLTFVKVFLGREKKRAGAATGWYDSHKQVKFSTWLFTLQHNNCMDVLRRRQTHLNQIEDLGGETEMDQPVSNIGDVAAQNPLDRLLAEQEGMHAANVLQQVGAAIDKLPPTERTVIELRFYLREQRETDEEKLRTLDEIAQITGLSIAKVHRVLKKVTNNLQDLLLQNAVYELKEDKDEQL